MAPMKSKAIVAREPTTDPPSPNWTLEDIEVGEPGEKQVLVRMVASGICHTDVVLTSVPQGVLGIEYPKVAGHEGSGIVEKVGPGVKSVSVGDPVLMSFDHCKHCDMCDKGHPAYCDEFPVRNYLGSTNSFKVSSSEDKTWGSFFGQSSFAAHSIVSESSIVNAKELIKNEEELKLFAPLGCGLQTGAGVITNVAQPRKDDAVLVMGLGGVGLSSIMASKISGCETIIALDRTESRLQLAKQLGATHTLNTTKADFDMSEEVRKITPGGANVVVETTGVPFIAQAGLKSTSKRGQFVHIGVPPLEFEAKMNGIEMINSGIAIRGNIEGDSIPANYVPQMIKWYREGKFPFDKFCTEFPVDQYGKALHAMHEGSTIKPILIF